MGKFPIKHRMKEVFLEEGCCHEIVKKGNHFHLLVRRLWAKHFLSFHGTDIHGK